MTAYPDLIAKRAELCPDRVAMRDLVSGEETTYRELEQSALGCAGLLAENGVSDGDRVAILCRNRIEFFVVLFACAKLGAILVPLNWRMPALELASIIQNCTPKIVLVGEEDRETLTSLDLEIPTFDLDENGPRAFQANVAKSKILEAREFWPSEETWYLLYTSGTTGAPKPVIQSYRMAVGNYVNVRQAIDLREGDRTLNFLPLFHTAGINLYTLPVLLAGGEVNILPGFDPKRTISLLAEGTLDIFFAVPAVYQELSLQDEFSELNLSQVRSWGCGGAPLADVLVSKYAAQGALVCNGYGMTETGPMTFLMPASQVESKIGSIGKCQLLTASRIVDSEGQPTEANQTGELQLKGSCITPGYWNNSEATKSNFTDDGWLKTGDLATFDEDGFHFIVGRSKEMFISGGENVYPAEVENALAHHPSVLEAAVVGVQDEKWGEVGKAYVLLRAGQKVDADALMLFARQHIAAYKVPKTYEFVDQFPRTAAGKIQKHLLGSEV